MLALIAIILFVAILALGFLSVSVMNYRDSLPRD